LALQGQSDIVPKPKSKPKIKSTLKGLNVMEAAVRDRFVRMKEETANEEAEAVFVDEMEKTQVKNKRRAIFAPGFTSMVLSAVAQAGPNFEKHLNVRPLPIENEPSVQAHGVQSGKTDGAEQDDEDDDMPLFSLGEKRSSNEGLSSASSKRTKTGLEWCDLGFHPLFLAKTVMILSKAWGHVYREVSHSDYSWRWEVHHGQTSESYSSEEGGKCKNPRTPGSLSLENLNFALDDKILERLATVPYKGQPYFGDDDAERAQQYYAMDMVLVGHLVSPLRTGLLDELLALKKVGILQTSDEGAAVLADDWFTRVDPLVLDDMENHNWDNDISFDKFMVHPRVRRELRNYWMRIDGAWALNEDLGEVIFVDEEWNEWRRTFEEKRETKSSEADGIGKFGI